MSLICEISGDSIATLPSHVVVVVTPSGHVCCKHLLEQLLKDNHNVDPFDNSSGSKNSLHIEDTIVLKQRNSASTSSDLKVPASTPVIPPRTNNSNSMTQLVQQVQNEYDTTVLELYTTKKLLHETRQELSMALYQNDAAIRVLARLSQERDHALQQVQQWNVHASATINSKTFNGQNDGRKSLQDDTSNEQESDSNIVTKKQKIDNDSSTKEILTNRIPEQDYTIMIQTWERLHESRRARQKLALAKANTIIFQNNSSVDVDTDTAKSNYQIVPSTISIHQQSDSDITTILKPFNYHNSTIIQCCNVSNEYVIYEPSLSGIETNKYSVPLEDNVQSTTKLDGITCMDTIITVEGDSDSSSISATTTFIAMVLEANNEIVLYKNHTLVYRSCTTHNNTYVNVQFHPDEQHIVLLSMDGTIHICRYEKTSTTDSSTNMEYTVSFITQFTSLPPTKCNNGVLHPDGLIYVTAATDTGNLLLWDFKSQQLATTLNYPNSDNDDNAMQQQPQQERIVSSIEFSNNGYHLAVSYKSVELIHIWDLRKQSILQTLNKNGNTGNDDNKNNILEQIMSIKFDDSGKYLAYSGKVKDNNDCIVIVVAVKKWDVVATFKLLDTICCYGLLWNTNHSIAISTIGRAIKNNENDDVNTTTEVQVVYFNLQS